MRDFLSSQIDPQLSDRKISTIGHKHEALTAKRFREYGANNLAMFAIPAPPFQGGQIGFHRGAAFDFELGLELVLRKFRRSLASAATPPRSRVWSMFGGAPLGRVSIAPAQMRFPRKLAASSAAPAEFRH